LNIFKAFNDTWEKDTYNSCKEGRDANHAGILPVRILSSNRLHNLERPREFKLAVTKSSCYWSKTKVILNFP
jgi:hypothetical protein